MLDRVYIGTRKSDGGREMFEARAGYSTTDFDEYSSIEGPYTSRKFALDLIARKKKPPLVAQQGIAR